MSPRSVFLNVPYDDSLQPLFLGYLVGIIGFGLVPRASVELPRANHRIQKIIDLIHSCDFSFHDLSRVEIEATSDSLPRFNLPFELGLAYHHAFSGSTHQCFLFEANHRRLEKTLSDLKGVDSYSHHNDVDGLFSELSAALIREDRMPTVLDMKAVYEMISDNLPNFLEDAGSKSVFHERVFHDLVFAINSYWNSRQVRMRSSQA